MSKKHGASSQTAACSGGAEIAPFLPGDGSRARPPSPTYLGGLFLASKLSTRYCTSRRNSMRNFGIAHQASADEQREPVTLHHRRGLLRVWLLVSIGWILGWAIYLVMDGMQGGLTTRGEWAAIPITL